MASVLGRLLGTIFRGPDHHEQEEDERARTVATDQEMQHAVLRQATTQEKAKALELWQDYERLRTGASARTRQQSGGGP
jgi:hypothetical protein